MQPRTWAPAAPIAAAGLGCAWLGWYEASQFAQAREGQNGFLGLVALGVVMPLLHAAVPGALALFAGQVARFASGRGLAGVGRSLLSLLGNSLYGLGFGLFGFALGFLATASDHAPVAGRPSRETLWVLVAVNSAQALLAGVRTHFALNPRPFADRVG